MGSENIHKNYTVETSEWVIGDDDVSFTGNKLLNSFNLVACLEILDTGRGKLHTPEISVFAQYVIDVILTDEFLYPSDDKSRDKFQKAGVFRFNNGPDINSQSGVLCCHRYKDFQDTKLNKNHIFA
ncbi:hypothetical protein SDC9_158658 [bioreactor metagenome]|uniref:Uncharacterized protein n=1 Tax=bioreactor metagenome TaxID=1076179 RepID=A0A645FAS3_9ZZZZ